MNLEKTIVDVLYEEGCELLRYLSEQKEITLRQQAENSFKKSFLLAAASFFEKEVSEMVERFADCASNSNKMLVGFVLSKAIKRQYHTYFDWEGKNANSFFALFGEDFKKRMDAKVRESQELERSVRAFLDLGLERNKLVHKNYGEVVIDKTAEELYLAYQLARSFMAVLRAELVPEA